MSHQRMTERQAKFVDAYMAAGTAAEAARRAGYAQSTASRMAHQLLRHPLVSKEIERRQAELRTRADLTAADVLAQLREDREFARKTENATAAVRASELMAKLTGHLIDRHQIDARVASFSLSIEGIDLSQRLAPAGTTIEHQEA